MPAADLAQRRANFARLRGSLTPHCSTGRGNASSARRWATGMPLTHASSIGKLGKILGDAALLSPQQSGSRIGKAEQMLGTADDVFLYAGSFSYPETECGFLFVRSFEETHHEEGVATPFDSGSITVAGRVDLPPSCGDRVAFVRDHEVPVGDYRELLETVLSDYLSSPDDYLRHPEVFCCHCGEPRSHPFGLSGGDCRAATFEVRIPRRVPLNPPHLRAVFVREGFEIPGLSGLFAAGVTIENYPAADDADFFYAMKESCIRFIEEQLML